MAQFFFKVGNGVRIVPKTVPVKMEAVANLIPVNACVRPDGKGCIARINAAMNFTV